MQTLAGAAFDLAVAELHLNPAPAFLGKLVAHRIGLLAGKTLKQIAIVEEDDVRLEEIAHKSVLIGFPMLALGVALGAWWANDAWGRYWGWDPKETSALVTWLIYAGYLHARGLRGWRGKRSMWLLVIAYGAVLFTYFAVNLWVSGLHSYSGV